MYLLALALAAVDQITIDPNFVGPRINPAMYGACIEDVNHEIYGGLYAQRIFGESFEEPAPTVGPAGWHALGGEWFSHRGAIVGPSGDGPKLLLDRPAKNRGEVSAQILIPLSRDGNAGFLARMSHGGIGADNFDGYEIALDAKAHKVILGRHEHDFRLLASAPVPAETSQWHTLRLAYDGPNLKVFFDQESTPRIDFRDDHPLIGGDVALRTWQTVGVYQDVRVDGQAIDLTLNESGVSGLWDPIGPGEFARENYAYNGDWCQLIQNRTNKTVGIANRGLNRWGISVKRGQAMEGRIYLKGKTTITVALQSADGRRTYAQQRLTGAQNWTKRAFKLQPNQTDSNARFAILLNHKGDVCVDQAVLLDGDRFQGLPIRTDIARAMKAEGLKFLRYGGTMVNVPGYRWKSMIGDPDRRPPYRGNWYPYSTNGFGIFDFLTFCEALHVDAAFAINIEEAPQDAADLADYLTAPVTNPWGRRRAQDGHPKPYNPTYIEIGNEEGISNADHAMPHYAERFRLLAHAIHRRNPKIKLVCAAWWMPDSPLMKPVFDAVDGEAAAWDFHFWSDAPDAGKSIDRDLTKAEKQFHDWDPNTHLKVVVFEENGNRHDLQRALGHVSTLNATRKHAGFVLADCAANALQPLGQNDNGWDQGQIFFTPSQAWSMPPADAHRMLIDDAMPFEAKAEIAPDLDALVTRNEEGTTFVITAVNPSSNPKPIRIQVKGGWPGQVVICSLSGPLPAIDTPKTKGTQTEVRRMQIEGDTFTATLPPTSISSIRLTKARR